jgi:hypothetical protein
MKAGIRGERSRGGWTLLWGLGHDVPMARKQLWRHGELRGSSSMGGWRSESETRRRHARQAA